MFLDIVCRVGEPWFQQGFAKLKIFSMGQACSPIQELVIAWIVVTSFWSTGWEVCYSHSHEWGLLGMCTHSWQRCLLPFWISVPVFSCPLVCKECWFCFFISILFLLHQVSILVMARCRASSPLVTDTRSSANANAVILLSCNWASRS